MARGNFTNHTTIAPELRFLRKVQIGLNSCWNWQGSLRHGYGQFWNGNSLEPAHRYSYRKFIGEIPEGLVLDHLCRNTKCCNPLHLEAVSNWENTLRGSHPFAANAKKTHCKRDHEFTESNTYLNKRDQRVCRACQATWQRERRNANN